MYSPPPCYFKDGILKCQILWKHSCSQRKASGSGVNSILSPMDMNFTKDPLGFWHKFILPISTHMGDMVSWDWIRRPSVQSIHYPRVDSAVFPKANISPEALILTQNGNSFNIIKIKLIITVTKELYIFMTNVKCIHATNNCHYCNALAKGRKK